MVGAGTLDNNENNYHSDYSAMVVKTDKCGNTLWRNFYDNKQGYFYNNTIYKVIGAGGYLYLLGGTQEYARAGTTFVAKINEEGELIWYKIFHPDDNDINSSEFFMNNTDQLVIYGNHEDRQARQLKMFIMVLDTNGEIINQKEYQLNKNNSPITKLFKTGDGYLCMAGVDTNYTFAGNTTLYRWGPIICRMDNNFEITNIDTIKSNYNTSSLLIDYSPNLKKYIIYLEKWVSTDSSHRQIAFIDSSGRLEKIIEDPFKYNVTPVNLIAFKNGWIANYDFLIFYDEYFSEKSRIQITRNDTGYFKASNTIIVKNGDAIIVTGGCRQCNPFDDNSNYRYDRPTAIMIDSNFKDFGKAQPPIEPPKPFAAIRAFPNPALESITLQITETEAAYSIYNSMGMFVSAGSMASSADISLLNMASGMYIVQLKSPQGNYIGNVKFLKK
jgi:hypothetical protein